MTTEQSQKPGAAAGQGQQCQSLQEIALAARPSWVRPGLLVSAPGTTSAYPWFEEPYRN